MYELACCGCMWVRRRIYHNGAPAPAVMDARHRHTALYKTALYNTALYSAILFNGVHHTLCCTSPKQSVLYRVALYPGLL